MIIMTVTVPERLEAEVPGERGPLQEPGISRWNAHQTGGVAETNGLGFGEIIFFKPFPMSLWNWISAVIT